jgi:hypothetical protein
MAGEPQTDVCIIVVDLDEIVPQAPNAAANEKCLLVVPDGANFQLEVLGVSYRANQLPIDGSNNVNFDLEWFDDSAADADTDLITAFEMDGSGLEALVMNPVWRGSQILDPGDVLNAEFDVTDPDTAGQGCALIIEYRVLRRS